MNKWIDDIILTKEKSEDKFRFYLQQCELDKQMVFIRELVRRLDSKEVFITMNNACWTNGEPKDSMHGIIDLPSKRTIEEYREEEKVLTGVEPKSDDWQVEYAFHMYLVRKMRECQQLLEYLDREYGDQSAWNVSQHSESYRVYNELSKIDFLLYMEKRGLEANYVFDHLIKERTPTELVVVLYKSGFFDHIQKGMFNGGKVNTATYLGKVVSKHEREVRRICDGLVKNELGTDITQEKYDEITSLLNPYKTSN